MVLGATVALWGALVGACVGLFRARRRSRFVLKLDALVHGTNDIARFAKADRY